ncbi:hypothetical protein [Telmatospirillum siberiense]|nr:hypothetical protein [Telmatospirillum siberiense]
MLFTIVLVTLVLFLIHAFRRWSQGRFRTNQGQGVTLVIVTLLLLLT